MKLFKKLLLLVLVLACSCTMVFARGQIESLNDIVVLYTNDVHCGIDDNLGYAGLAAYKSQVEQKTSYVTLVDCGDALQGDLVGTVSNGEYLVDIMNKAGYKYAVLGNHEFDYGMPQLKKLIGMSDAQYLGCNVNHTGSGENLLAALKPYAIETYGATKVAYIGVSTPESITKSTPAYFQDEKGNFVYNFTSGNNGKDLYARVQSSIDACKAAGADYVIVLSHLGDDPESSPYRSIDLIENTTGIDALLDGHSHSVISAQYVADRNGKQVLLSSTGTKLNFIGQLVITSDGMITTSLVQTPLRDTDTVTFINGIKANYEAQMNKVVATSDVDLTIKGDGGARLIRTRETNLGDLCADAYRSLTGADIGFVNGGGIRASIAKGNIKLADIIKVHPYGNMLCMVKCTGQEVLDCLEMASRFTKKESADGTNAVGECGGFQQVSGLKYTIDTSVPSSVKLDANGMFVSVDGPYRVKDVMVVKDDGTAEPLDLKKEYTLASHNYMIKQKGDGFTMFADNQLLLDETMIDNQVLIHYITDKLGGKVGSQYAKPQGRITVL